jgi:hypothetical protein
LFRLDALIRWLDSADARVRAMTSAPKNDTTTPTSLVTRRTIKVVM